MLIFYILLFVIVVSALRYNRNFNVEYISFDTTNAVKGIFILIVFISHIVPYIVKSGYDAIGGGSLFWLIHNRVGQWVVAMFLFYSGFGIMESIKKKGNSYIQGIPRRRILKTLVNFDIAVVVFIIVAIAIGTPLTIKKCLLSFTGWESVGNSNWYILVILLCYAITFISFRKQNSLARGALLCLGLLFITLLFLSCFKDSWWYDTILCYGAGILYSLYRDKVESYVLSNYWKTFIAVIVLAFGVNIVPLHLKGIVYNCFSVLFCASVVIFTMRFNLKSNLLVWCGKNLFPLYIYQRIPMIILANVAGGAFIVNYPVIYVWNCLLITVVITFLYKFLAVKF